MTRKELEAKLENLQDRKFILNMADRWTRKDFEMDDKLTKEIAEVKKQLAEMEE